MSVKIYRIVIASSHSNVNSSVCFLWFFSLLCLLAASLDVLLSKIEGSITCQARLYREPNALYEMCKDVTLHMACVMLLLWMV